MKAVILILTFIFLVACSDNDNSVNPIENNFTVINGKLSGELTVSKSPYLVTQSITVDSNSTLLINAGVQLYFEGNTQLVVNGELVVEGSDFHPVVFKSNDITKKWNGIKIINADHPIKLDFVKLQDIRQETDTLEITSSISIINSEVEFRHSIIFQNSSLHGGAIGVYDSKLVLINNIFRDNSADVFGGALFCESSDITIINNTFYQNSSANSGGSIFVYTPMKTDLQNNIFYKNTSRVGNPNFEFASSDSSNLIEQYYYIPFGTMNPKFVDELTFILNQTSPCINNGNPDTTFNDSDNSRNDQGAYGGPLGNW